MPAFITNLAIWKKSLLPLALLTVVTGLVIAYMTSTVTGVTGQYARLVDHSAPATLWLARANQVAVDTSRTAWETMGEVDGNRPQTAKEYAGLKQQFLDNLAKARALLIDPRALNTLASLQAEYEALFDIGSDAVRRSLAGDFAGAQQTMSTSFGPAYKKLRPEIRAFVEGLTAQMEQHSAELAASGQTATLYSLIGSGAGVMLCVVLGIWIALNGVVRPMTRLTDAAGKLANRDWTTDVPGTTRRDELGAMARSVEVFKTNGQDADRLTAEQQAQQAVREQRAVRLNQLTSAFESTAGQLVGVVSSAAAELQATATSMTGIANDTTQQAASVAAATGQASGNVQTVAVAAEEMSSSINEISRQIAESTQATQAAVEASRQTNNIVQDLAEKAQQINSVVELISGIAAQTNLLALNATIEAARAGEAGRGFAVVASEVKSLAGQTAKATAEIGDQVQQMQSATRQAVTAIQGINSRIDRVNEIATAIGAAVEEQGSATQEIARNVQQAAQGTQNVATNISKVTEGANATGAAAGQVLSAAQELSQQAENLSGEVNRFVRDVKAA